MSRTLRLLFLTERPAWRAVPRMSVRPIEGASVVVHWIRSFAARPPARWLPRLALAVIVSLLSAPGTAADRIEVTDASLSRVVDGTDSGTALDASFDFELPGVLEDAVNRGIALYFVVDFELYRERWWWFDRQLVSESRLFRLTYSPLTRQYRIGSGALALPFESISDALATMRKIHSWNVVGRGVLKPGEDYRAQVRMRLDTSQLPKPFQVNALTNRDWALSSDWRSVPVTPEVAR